MHGLAGPVKRERIEIPKYVDDYDLNANDSAREHLRRFIFTVYEKPVCTYQAKKTIDAVVGSLSYLCCLCQSCDGIRRDVKRTLETSFGEYYHYFSDKYDVRKPKEKPEEKPEEPEEPEEKPEEEKREAVSKHDKTDENTKALMGLHDLIDKVIVASDEQVVADLVVRETYAIMNSLKCTCTKCEQLKKLVKDMLVAAYKDFYVMFCGEVLRKSAIKQLERERKEAIVATKKLKTFMK